MKLRHAFALLAIPAMAACAPQDAEEAAEPMAQSAAEMSADEAALEQFRADYVTHYNLGHADMVAAMFSDSAVMLSANGAVLEGRAAIEASLAEQFAGSPSVEITTGETMVMGDAAVARGSYSVDMTAESGPMTVAGNYMTMFMREDGAWKIGALLTNFDAAPPEGYPMDTEESEPPPENGTMGDLVSAYVTHFNQGHADMVADLFTDDAVFAFANLPLAEGKAAIAAALGERMAMGSPQLEIHDVGTFDMGDGWAVDGGWYSLTADSEDGKIMQSGAYFNLCRQQADGSWKIHWGASNGVPQPAM